MADIEKTVETNVQDVDINLDEIFSGAPGASSVTLPEEKEEKKPNVFSREGKVDMSFLNEEDAGKQEEPVIEEPKDESTDLNEKVEETEEAKEGVEVKETLEPVAKGN